MLIEFVLFQHWQKGAKGRLRISHQAEVDFCAPAQLFATDIDLNDCCVVGKELLVWKVRSNHQQHVAVHHCVIPGGEPEHAGHAHIERVVILDELLPAHRMHNRGVQLACESDQLRMRSGTARSPEDRCLLRVVQYLCQHREFLIGGTHTGLRRRKVQTRPLFDGIAKGHVARQGNDGNTAPRQRGLHGNLEHAGHLLGLRNQFTIVAALREEMFRVSFLKVSAADFIAWNLRRDGEDRNPAAVTVVEPVDQMQVPGTAAPGADGQPSCEMRFRSSGKRCRLFMSHMNPLNLLLCPNRVRDAVKRVAGNTVNLPNTC